jgi:putative ABC transport system substrate-binding protein
MRLLGGAGVWPFAVRAQEERKTYRLGLLRPGMPVLSGDDRTKTLSTVGVAEERTKALLSGLAARGFISGQNLVVEERSGGMRMERLGALAAELKAAGVNVIVTFGYPAAVAAKTWATDVPVVVTGAGDPVATGLVDGLARPGGNVTGVTELSTELSAKRLEILREAVADLRRVAMLWNAADLGMTLRYRAAEDAARVLGISVQTLGVREPDDFDQAFAEMTRERPDAILMVSDALTLLNRKRILEFARAQRLPTIFEVAALVRDGGLMSYGPNQAAIGERAGDFVARILRGARPAELPLEQPTRFEFVINLDTAKALGLTITPALLVRADEVIEREAPTSGAGTTPR